MTKRVKDEEVIMSNTQSGQLVKDDIAITVNAYDFDKTIYDGDSTADFYRYCLKKYKKTLVFLFPNMIYGVFFLLKLMKKTNFKQRVYRFLWMIPDIDKALEDFWKTHKQKIKTFYLQQRRPDDFIISASPEFLLKPMIDELGLRYLIASRVDKKTGFYTGLNCYGDEKVKRLKEQYPNVRIDAFYSDSRSDAPLAEISNRAFLVTGEHIGNW